MKKIAYTRPDGGVSIVIPAPKYDLERVLGPLTDESYEAHVWERSIPNDAINPQYIDEHPADRRFRNAWTHDGENGVFVHMDKARDLHMNRIRAARNTRLAELDKRKYGAEFDAERKTLRDIPQIFDLTKAKTPEELKLLWPDNL